MSDKQFIEYSKQCFYLNLFNFLILFKITEVCVLKPTKTFGLKNFNSWIAIMHNSSIILSGQTFTAYQIKHDVIKNLKRRPSSSWCVDHRFVHPLIEYAFFLPFQGNLRLNQLCFTNVAHLSYQLARNVNQKLRNQIKVKEHFNVIMLPASLKDCFSPDMQKISYDIPNACQEHVYRILKFIHAEIMLLGC